MKEREFHPVLRPRDASPDVEPERSCGECTLCCTVLRVDALRKLGGVACTHLVSDTGGCGIYSDRPRICRSYRCLWLQGGLDEGDRPDKLGAVLDLLTAAGTARLSVRELVPGAADENDRLRVVIERYREAIPVRISDVHDVMSPNAPFRVLLPGNEEHRVAGDVREVWREGRRVETGKLPLTERLARRLITRFQAFRLRGYGDGSRSTRM